MSVQIDDVSRQRPIEPTPTELSDSGNSLCFSLDEFLELSWVARYMNAQTQLQQSIATLTAEIAMLDRQRPIDGGHIEQYQVTRKGRTYTYYRYRWYVGLTQAGNPKLKQIHLTNRMKVQYEERMAIGAQKRLLEQERSRLQAQSDTLRQLVREIQFDLYLPTFPNFSVAKSSEEVRP